MDRLKFQDETERNFRDALGEPLWNSYPNWTFRKGEIMDDGLGRLRMLEDEEVRELGGPGKMDTMEHYFRVGEEVQIKGSTFRVQRVSPKGLRLKVLKWDRE